MRQGLGELYEDEYQAAAGHAAEDKEEPLRAQARVALKHLFLKLDALSHWRFAPKPVLEEMAVRADVPALLMEEVAPQVRRPCPCRFSMTLATALCRSCYPRFGMRPLSHFGISFRSKACCQMSYHDSNEVGAAAA